MLGRNQQMTVAKQPQAVFPTVLESKGEELTMSGVWAPQVSLYSSGPKCCQGNAESPGFPESNVNREGLNQQDFPGKSVPPGGRERPLSWVCASVLNVQRPVCQVPHVVLKSLSSGISLGAWQEDSGRLGTCRAVSPLGFKHTLSACVSLNHIKLPVPRGFLFLFFLPKNSTLI